MFVQFYVALFQFYATSTSIRFSLSTWFAFSGGAELCKVSYGPLREENNENEILMFM